MVELDKEEALSRIMRHGGERNCEHLRSPKALQANRGSKFESSNGGVMCAQCASQTVVGDN